MVDSADRKTPRIIDNHPLAEELFADWWAILGEDAQAYRNHVYRVLNFTFALGDFSDEQQRQLVIAGVFHDLGIWSDNSFDYLEPSVARAHSWLQENGQEASLPAVAAIIREHHKLTPYREQHALLVDAFRRADLADVSLGLVTPGIPRAFVRDVRRHFPNGGFHKRLLQLAWSRFLRHPLSPLPMLKW